MNRRLTAFLACALLAATSPAKAASAKKMSPDMKAADAYVTKAFGDQCMRHDPDAGPIDDDADKRYDIKFKYSYDTPDMEDNVFHLYAMFCSMGAYNIQTVFLTRDEDGNFQTLAFAQPQANYEYVDDTDTKLKNPPVMTGIASVTYLVNAEYDPKTKSIIAVGKWRGLGDAYDEATYEFKDGQFLLTKYIVDPIYDANLEGKDGEALADEKYTLYELPNH